MKCLYMFALQFPLKPPDRPHQSAVFDTANHTTAASLHVMSSQSLLHNAMNPSGSHAFQGLSHFAGFTPPPPCGPAVPDLHPEGFHGVERAPTPPADWDNTTSEPL